jgi:ATP-dependent phosphoenolpyruvate carboxykinase
MWRIGISLSNLIVIALFDDSIKTWNVNHLDNILNRIGVELPGVNTAYLYFGQWKATFAWHVEVRDREEWTTGDGSIVLM